MDGVASATAIIAVIQTGAQVTTALYSYLSSVRNAKSSATKLLEQIRLITAAETAIQSVVNDFPASSRTDDLQVLMSEWNKEDGPPAKCKKELEELLHWLASQDEKKRNKIKQLFWPAHETKIKATIRTFEGYMPYFRDVLAIDILKQLQIFAKEQRQRDNERKKQEYENAKRELLEWLGVFDSTTKHEFILRQRRDKTCNWFLQEVLYLSWRNSTTKFLWLHGGPGMGKSVLASAVIDDLCSGQEPQNEMIAYFYCDFRNPQDTSAVQVLLSLTEQLLKESKSDWVGFFPDLTQRKKRGIGPPSDIRMLSDILKRAGELHDNPVIVIDALDECQDLEQLLEALVRVNDGHLRLFVTSRTLLPIREAFTDLPSIFLGDKIEKIQNDILLHINSEIESRKWLMTLGEDLKDNIRHVLAKKAAGMFRWVQCQMDMLNQCVSEHDVYEVLNSLPETLYETYDLMLRAIEKNKFWKPVAQKAFQWLVMSLRPLTLLELAEALEIDYDTDSPIQHSTKRLDAKSILVVCGSFVSFDATTGIISLSHYSVKEYLTLETTGNCSYYVDPPRASAQIASVSLRYFTSDLNRLRKPRGLRSYAIDFGFYHLRDCPPDANGRLLRLLSTIQNCFSSYLNGLHPSLPDQLCTSPTVQRHLSLCIILRFGSLSMLCKFLEQNPGLDPNGDNPLVYAARHCDPKRVQLLLDNGVDANVEGTFRNMYTTPRRLHRVVPLTAAGSNERAEYRETLLTLFLAHGCTVPKDALFSVLQHHCDPTIVCILLENGADPMALQNGRQTALHRVLSRSLSAPEIKVIQLLVNAGCDPTVPDDRGISPFHLAIRGRSVALVQWLVGQGFKIPQDAILHAVLQYIDDGHRMLDMLHFLVSQEVNVNAVDSSGCNALHVLARHANYCDYETMAQAVLFLVEKGCDINQKNLAAETPLHRVVASSHKLHIAEFFISQGARLPPDIINFAVRYHVQHSESRVQSFFVPLIETYGVSCQSKTATGDNALHCLLRHKNTRYNEDPADAISFLLENGCDKHAPDSSGDYPCHIAIEHGHLSIAQSLSVPIVDTKVNVPLATDSEGNSILHRLCYQVAERNIYADEFLERVKLLQSTGYEFSKYVDLRNKKGYTPLCIVLRGKNLFEVVSWLLELGARFSDVSPLCLENIKWASRESRDLPWYNDALDADRRPKPTFEDVTQLYHLLLNVQQSKLPTHVVRLITDMAGYWAYTKVLLHNIRQTAYPGERIPWPTLPNKTDWQWIPRRVVFSCKLQHIPRYASSNAQVSLWIRRQNVPYEIPINLEPSPKKVSFDVWDEHTPAERFDESKIALADMTPEDALTLQFSDEFNEASELLFFQMEVYYMISPNAEL